MGIDAPGFVPQVIMGSMSAASRTTSWSKVAPSSVASERHCATAASHSAPWGAKGRPFRYSIGGVVGRDHARAPARFDRHVADGHALFHGERAHSLAAVLDDVAGGAADPDAARSPPARGPWP
jgi:hypothetical protein